MVSCQNNLNNYVLSVSAWDFKDTNFVFQTFQEFLIEIRYKNFTRFFFYLPQIGIGNFRTFYQFSIKIVYFINKNKSSANETKSKIQNQLKYKE